MEKSTIEYINQIRRKREEKIEIKNMLIKKINYCKGISREKKENIISKITSEFENIEKNEKSLKIYLEILKQNQENEEKKDALINELVKIKNEIQREKRRCNALKKILLDEDFSGTDEYSIKRKKVKWDETKIKILQINNNIKTLETRKSDINMELSQINVFVNGKRFHSSGKYKRYSIDRLLNYNIGLSEKLQNEIKNELKASSTVIKNNQTNFKKHMKYNVGVLNVARKILLFVLVICLSGDTDLYVNIIIAIFILAIIFITILFIRLWEIFKDEVVGNTRNTIGFKIKTTLGIFGSMISLLFVLIVSIFCFVKNTLLQG